MSTIPGKKVRILALWGSSMFDNYVGEMFRDNPRFEVEIVSGDRTSGPSPYAAPWSRLWSLRRRLARGEFDIVISGTIQNSVWPRPKRLATCLAQAFRFLTYKQRMVDCYWTPWLLAGHVRNKVPLAVIDHLDPIFLLPRDYPLLKACTLYFKLNLFFWHRRTIMPLENLYGIRRVIGYTPKLRPMTHGVPRSRIPATSRPMRERDLDVCFTGNVRLRRAADDPNLFGELTNNTVRQEIYDRVVKLKESGRYRVFCIDDRVPDDEYYELLQRAKLFVCAESFGCETWRHWEVGAAGSVPLINWIYSTGYKPYEPDVHAIYFSLIGEDFERTVDRALADPDKLQRISHAVREYTITYKERTKLGEMVVEETMKAWRERQAAK